MVPLSVLGLNWCAHGSRWLLALYDPQQGRLLQITVSPADAVMLGQVLAGQPSERSGLYTLVGALLRQQPQLASIQLALDVPDRARTALVLSGDGVRRTYPTSTADGVALAIRAGLPIYADEQLLERFGIGGSAESPPDTECAPGTSPIPAAFRRALEATGPEPPAREA
jgi:bifunctional DNase/RNase